MIGMLMLLSCAIILSIVQDGHCWGDDFALYISQAKALDSGGLNELFFQNKFSMDHSVELLGPYLYPFGFPLLLWPMLKIFGLHFFILKNFCALFFIFSIPIIFNLFKSSFKYWQYPFILIALLALNSSFITFSDNVLSDLPFFFFCFLSLFAFTSSKKLSKQIGLGFLIYFTYKIRDIGIILLPSLFIYQLSSIIIEHDKNRRVDIGFFAIPYFIYFILFFISYKVFPHGGQNHLKLLYQNLNFTLIKDNHYYYKDLIKALLHQNNLAYYILLFLFILGLIKNLLKKIHFIVFIFLYYFVLLIWPSHQGVRFIFPLIPFLFYYVLLGIQIVFSYFHFTKIKVALVISCLLLYANFQFLSIKNYSKTSSNESYTKELRQVYKVIQEKVDKNEIIVFNKPRALRLYTGRNAVFLHPNAYSKFRYLFLVGANNFKNIDSSKVLIQTKNCMLVRNY